MTDAKYIEQLQSAKAELIAEKTAWIVERNKMKERETNHKQMIDEYVNDIVILKKENEKLRSIDSCACTGWKIGFAISTIALIAALVYFGYVNVIKI